MGKNSIIMHWSYFKSVYFPVIERTRTRASAKWEIFKITRNLHFSVVFQYKSHLGVFRFCNVFVKQFNWIIG